MKTTPIINNGGQMEPVWFQERGLIRSEFAPVVNIGGISNRIHADAIGQLIEALRVCQIDYEDWKAKNKK